MVKLAVAVWPAATLTGGDVPPFTLQLLGAPLRGTVGLSGSRSCPVVAAVTVRSPVSAVHVMVNVVEAVPPAGTLTLRGFGAVTVQLAATPLSSTWWSPVGSPLKVTPVGLLLVIGWLVV